MAPGEAPRAGRNTCGDAVSKDHGAFRFRLAVRPYVGVRLACRTLGRYGHLELVGEHAAPKVSAASLRAAAHDAAFGAHVDERSLMRHP
jgi:hypothetical protein